MTRDGCRVAAIAIYVRLNGRHDSHCGRLTDLPLPQWTQGVEEE